MRAHTPAVNERLAVSYALDHLWSETMGLAEGDTKQGPLRQVAELLEREAIPYALIGGVAVQLHTAEPRSTLDIDLAVPRYADIPREALLRAGFEHTGRHDHSDNWRAPGAGSSKLRTAIQFSAEDEGIVAAVEHARTIELGNGVRLRVAAVPELVFLKLLAAEEPSRRPSKREHDVADVLALFEEHPSAVTPELLERLQRVRLRLLGLSDASSK